MKTFFEPYVNFNGNCEEAMLFYGEVFGSEPSILRISDVPEQQKMGMDASQGVLHAAVRIGNSALMASDDFMGSYRAGNHTFLSYSAEDPLEVQRVWKAFEEKGSQVIMPLEETFWSAAYGILLDPYGVQWMIQQYDPQDYDK